MSFFGSRPLSSCLVVWCAWGWGSFVSWSALVLAFFIFLVFLGFLVSSCVLLCILNCWNCICFFPRCWMVFWVWPGVSILFLLVFLVFLVRCPLVLLRVCSCICFPTCTFLPGSICSLCWTWVEIGFPVDCRFFPRRLWFFLLLVLLLRRFLWFRW